jgi:hypothetical protein
MKQKLAWVLASLAIIALMGLSGAYFKGQETIRALQESKARLNEKLKAAEAAPDLTAECPAAPVDTSCLEQRMALEASLAEAQAAQRELTAQLKAMQAAPAAATAARNAAPMAGRESAPLFSAYLALRREVLRGENFATEWRLFYEEMPDIPEATQRVMAENSGGILTRAALRDALKAALVEEEKKAASEADAASGWQAQLAPYLSIRRMDEEDPLAVALENDALDEAADILEKSPRAGFELWRVQYKNRRAVLQALNAMESELLAAEEPE